MNRPLTAAERSAQQRDAWLENEAKKARETRGEKGQMEFWLRLARGRIAREAKHGRGDAVYGFAQICRLVISVLDLRAAGDPRLYQDLVRYAEQVLERHPPQR
ncbi:MULTISPECIES: hypothetical protein [unclassified Streptomyces]|uniref:hypothetical protein n=1 Tax=unclassified Streptomyces TaxID=2593676 RepID=UPI000BAC8E73|nr:hypothetical protein [Streptomyces sp. CLI2509]ASY37054.1 hypothetical protein CAC01_30950 [Streptomyces sp. CLI2509]MYX21162.1 hypothetical protein [Streptomyces sp. SID8380]